MSEIATIGSLTIDVSRIIYVRESRHMGYNTTYWVKLQGMDSEIQLEREDVPILKEFWEKYKAERAGGKHE